MGDAVSVPTELARSSGHCEARDRRWLASQRLWPVLDLEIMSTGRAPALSAHKSRAASQWSPGVPLLATAQRTISRATKTDLSFLHLAFSLSYP